MNSTKENRLKSLLTIEIGMFSSEQRSVTGTKTWGDKACRR